MPSPRWGARVLRPAVNPPVHGLSEYQPGRANPASNAECSPPAPLLTWDKASDSGHRPTAGRALGAGYTDEEACDWSRERRAGYTDEAACDWSRERCAGTPPGLSCG